MPIFAKAESAFTVSKTEMGKPGDRNYSREFDGIFIKLPANVRTRIVAGIRELGRRLETFPHTRLQGRPEFRLRIGDYRVIYLFNLQQNELFLSTLGHRRDDIVSKGSVKDFAVSLSDRRRRCSLSLQGLPTVRRKSLHQVRLALMLSEKNEGWIDPVPRRCGVSKLNSTLSGLDKSPRR